MTAYRTATGARLVILGSTGSPTDREVEQALRTITERNAADQRARDAQRTGICSDCWQTGPTTEIDSAGRCRECQP